MKLAIPFKVPNIPVPRFWDQNGKAWLLRKKLSDTKPNVVHLYHTNGFAVCYRENKHGAAVPAGTYENSRICPKCLDDSYLKMSPNYRKAIKLGYAFHGGQKDLKPWARTCWSKMSKWIMLTAGWVETYCDKRYLWVGPNSVPRKYTSDEGEYLHIILNPEEA